MPKLGEIKSGKELGYRINRTNRKPSWDYAKFIWLKCLICSKKRWVRLSKTKESKFTNRCKGCSDAIGWCQGNKHPNWKGGRWKDTHGYIWIRLSSNSFFSSMADNRHRVREHRLIMAQYLNRCLLPWEVVHHKNGTRDDNRLENLELLPHNRWHLVDMQTKRYIKKLEQRIIELERK